MLRPFISHVDLAFFDRHGGFLDGFRNRRMRVTGAGEVFGGPALGLEFCKFLLVPGDHAADAAFVEGDVGEAAIFLAPRVGLG